MTSTASTVSLTAPSEALWEVLADFAGLSRWATNIAHSSLLTPGAPGPGTVRRVQVGRTVLRETITRWEPDRALGYDIVGLPAVVRRASNTWTLAPDVAGTRVTLTSEVQTRGGPLLDRIVVRKLGHAGKELVQSLAAAVAEQHP